MSVKLRGPVVLGLHPTSKGFGWVVFRGPDAPIDWGLASARSRRPARLLSRFERILNRHEPVILVLEVFEHSERIERIKIFCREIVHVAGCKGIRTQTLLAKEVQKHFLQQGARTRHEIASAVAQHMEAFAHRLPPKRRAWMSLDPRRSLFDAAALVITYFAALEG